MLNEEARRDLKNEKLLQDGYKFEVSNGIKEFSEKEQIYFLRNNNELGVRNGTLGEITSINNKGDVEISIKGGEKEAFQFLNNYILSIFLISSM